MIGKARRVESVAGWVGLLAAVAMVLILPACGDAKEAAEPEQVQQPPVQQKAQPSPEERIADLEDGISYGDVARILGSEGRPKGVLTGPDGQKRVIFEWELGGRRVRVTFIDDQLTEWDAKGAK